MPMKYPSLASARAMALPSTPVAPVMRLERFVGSMTSYPNTSWTTFPPLKVTISRRLLCSK